MQKRRVTFHNEGMAFNVTVTKKQNLLRQQEQR